MTRTYTYTYTHEWPSGYVAQVQLVERRDKRVHVSLESVEMCVSDGREVQIVQANVPFVERPGDVACVRMNVRTYGCGVRRAAAAALPEMSGRPLRHCPFLLLPPWTLTPSLPIFPDILLSLLILLILSCASPTPLASSFREK